MLANDGPDVISTLPRLEDLTLSRLMTLDNPVLAGVLQEMIDGADTAPDLADHSAFQSGISP